MDNFQLHGSDADQSRQREVTGMLRDYIAHYDEAMARGVGILAFGSCGSGKDHLLTAVGMEYASLGAEIRHIQGLSMWARFRETMSRSASPDAESKFLKSLTQLRYSTSATHHDAR